MIKSNWFNVLLLALCQAMVVSVIAIVVFVASLIGIDLAPNAAWATLPNAAMVIGTAVCAVPLTLSMQRFGRRKVIFTAMCGAALANAVITYALSIKSFWLFSLATTGIGLSVASMGQFRFWAMESVNPQQKSTAAAIVLLGGVVAAFMGPELAVRGEYLLSERFAGTFLLATFLLIFTAATMYVIKEIGLRATEESQVPRPYREMLASSWLWAATLAAAMGYAVMTLIMTATPISMQHHFGHSLNDTKWVIQSHIMAMFLPSLIVPFLSRHFGLQRMVVLGVLLYFASIGFGLSGVAVQSFWLSLVLLGLGWNLLFISGTSLLPQTHAPHERFRAQAFNDGFIYTVQVIASLGSGVLLSWLGWKPLLMFCVPLAFIPLIALAIAKKRVPLPATIGV